MSVSLVLSYNDIREDRSQKCDDDTVFSFFSRCSCRHQRFHSSFFHSNSSNVSYFRKKFAMMSSLIDTLNNVSLNMSIYAGFIEWVAGNVGNGITIILFCGGPLRATRTAPFIMVLATLNIIYLNHSLLPKGISAVNRSFDGTFGNEILCIFRYFVPYSFITLIFSLLCWLAVDR